MGAFNYCLVKAYLKSKNDKRLDYLRELEKSLQGSYSEKVDWQFTQVKSILNFASKNFPFYQRWFDLHDVDIRRINDFNDFSQKVPILRKSDFLQHINLMSPNEKAILDRSVYQSTGGSTGQTLRFRMSPKDHQLGAALLLRGMGYGGYNIGDKILILAGGSLVKENQKFSSKIINYAFNQFKFSSYGLASEDLLRITKLIKNKNIQFLRGYASALYLLAECAEKERIQLKLNAVFSTSEQLLPQQRKTIERAFSCLVYDQYGLNDGGVSAFQYTADPSLLVDLERGYLEIDDPRFLKRLKSSGSILATSFFNTAFPFIRYDTGDIGELEFGGLGSISERPHLKKILGRETDFLIINKKKIASPVLTVLMGKTNVEQYRIIQKSATTLEFQIKESPNNTAADEDYIRKSIIDNCGPIDIVFKKVEHFDNLNKHKFIIREFEA